MGLDLVSYIIYLGLWNFKRREILKFEINSSMAGLISIMTKTHTASLNAVNGSISNDVIS